MKKILFPTDFSNNAKNAFQYALKIAKKIDAKIDIIHVYSVIFSDVAALPPGYVEQLIDDKKTAINQQLKDFTSGINPQFIAKSKAIYGVFPATEISDYAKNKSYDYIIMGTKGAQNPIDRIMGTVTTAVLMSSPCPVIAIPESAIFKEVHTIALATSFVGQNDHSIRQLQEFARQMQADIHLVHVASKRKEQKVEKIIEEEKIAASFSQFTIVHNSSVSQGLESFIEEYQIDMLALYIPNRRLWERIFHQSVSKRMALHTKTPLIVYHE